MKRLLLFTAVAFALSVYASFYKVDFIIFLVLSAVLLIMYALFRTRISFSLLVLSLVMLCSYIYTDAKLQGKTYNFPETVVSGSVRSISYDGKNSEILINSPEFGRVYINIRNYNASKNLSYGDIIEGELKIPDSEQDSFSKKYFWGKNIFLYGEMSAHSINIIPSEPEFSVGAIAYKVRSYIISSFNSYLPKDISQLSLAIFIGEKANLSEEISTAFSRCGLSHIIAVSGMHLSLIFSIAMGFFALFKIQRRSIVMVLYFLLIWFFTFITGGSAPVMRSAIMLSFVFLAWAFRRDADPLTSLAASVLILLIINPFAVFDVGLLLSVYSTAALILFARPISYKLPFIKSVNDALSVTLAASIGTIPVVSLYFGQLPLISPIANLIVAPFVPVMMILCILLFAFSFIPFIASGISVLLTGSVFLFTKISLVLSALPLASVKVPCPDIFTILIYLLLCTALYLMLNKKIFPGLLIYMLSIILFCGIMIINIVI